MWVLIVSILSFVCINDAAAPGYLSVNGVKVTINVTVFEKSTPYHSFGNYEFEGNSSIVVRCHANRRNHENLIQMSYAMKNPNKTIQLDSQYTYRQKIFIKLTRHNHGAYIDCSIDSNLHIIRLFFVYKKPINKAILWFQGLYFIPKQNDTPFIYEYYSGEKIRFKSLTDKEMQCETSGDSLIKKTHDMKPRTEFVFTWNVYSGTKYLECGLKKQTDKDKLHLLIKMERRKITNSPYMTGLSMGYTMADYMRNAIEQIILYEYNDSLFMTCSAGNYHESVSWDLNKTEVEVTSLKASNLEWIISGIFKLKANQKSSVITCIVYNYYSTYYSTYKIHVELFRTKKIDTDPAKDSIGKPFLEDKDEIRPNVTETENAGVKPSNAPSRGSSTSTVLLSACGVIILLIIIAISYVLILRQRKRNLPNKDEPVILYNNVHRHRGSAHIPRQQSDIYASPADTDTYSVPYSSNLNEMYSRAVPKSQRRPKELQYADLQMTKTKGIDEDSTYATIENDGVNQGPTKVKKVTGSGRENYAQIVLPKTGHDLTYANWDSRYVNELEPSYVNTGLVGDCVEPTYCEVNVKK